MSADDAVVSPWRNATLRSLAPGIDNRRGDERKDRTGARTEGFVERSNAGRTLDFFNINRTDRPVGGQTHERGMFFSAFSLS